MKKGFEIEGSALVTFWEVEVGVLPINARPVASGFVFMHPNIIVTARHVAERIFDSRRWVFPLVGSESCEKASLELPTKFWLDKERDIAIFQYESTIRQAGRPLYPAHFGIHEDPELAAIVLDVDKSESSPPSVTHVVHRIKEWHCSSRERTDSEYCLEFEAPWQKGGCSGGPLIDWHGCVVGVIIQSFLHNDGTGEKLWGRATSIHPAVKQFTFQGEDMPPLIDG